MKIKNSNFVKSAVWPEHYPIHDKAEIAFIGKSNVGKSSLINLLLNRKKLAKVSATPGKTANINFFEVNNEEFYIVDLPGYGYARRSKVELKEWSKMINKYLNVRENLSLFFLLIDIRRIPDEQDLRILDWLRDYGKNYQIILTKVDKVNQKEKNKQVKKISSILIEEPKNLILSSTLKKLGRELVLNKIQKSIDLYNEDEINLH